MTERKGIPEPVFEEDERTDVVAVVGPTGRGKPKREYCTLALLTGPEAGLVHVIDADETVLGRGHGCAVRSDDSGLSRHHCRIVKRGAAYFLEDMGSTNGTFIENEGASEPVRSARELKDGVRIRMGRETLLKFSVVDQLEADASRRLYESAMHDALTGVHNRRSLDERLRAEFAFAARHGTSLSLLLMDADHFKRVNDTHGHPAGDAVLRALAGYLKRSVRTEDLVARFGGEEFTVLVRGITVDGAMVLAERIRSAVEHGTVRIGDKQIRVTVSIGVVTMDASRGFPRVDAMLAAVDEALYAAKEGGRNRCIRG